MHFKDKSRYFSYLFHYCLDKFLIFLGCRVIWTFIPFVCCNIFQSIIHLISCFSMLPNSLCYCQVRNSCLIHTYFSPCKTADVKNMFQNWVVDLFINNASCHMFSIKHQKQVHQLRNFPPCFTSGQSSNWLFIR